MAVRPSPPPSSSPSLSRARTRYAARFGLYEGSKPAPPPANEVLIGREAQRARLLDLLLSAGRRGAYLITGYRGSGKTSFADFTVDQLRAHVYERFVRGQIGRRMPDLAFYVVVLATILGSALLVSELLDFWLNSNVVKISHAEVPYYAFGALLTGLLVLPCYHGIRLLRLAVEFDEPPPRSGPRRWSGNTRRYAEVLGALLTTGGLLILPGFASPTETCFYFIGFIGLSYGVVRICSVVGHDKLDVDPQSAFPRSSSRTNALVVGAMLALNIAHLLYRCELLYGDRLLVQCGIVSISGYMLGQVFRWYDSGSVRTRLTSGDTRRFRPAIAVNLLVAVAGAAIVLWEMSEAWCLRDTIATLSGLGTTAAAGAAYRTAIRRRRPQSIFPAAYVFEFVFLFSCVCLLVLGLGLGLGLASSYSLATLERYGVATGLLLSGGGALTTGLVVTKAILRNDPPPSAATQPWLRFTPRPRVALLLTATFVLTTAAQLLMPLFRTLVESPVVRNSTLLAKLKAEAPEMSLARRMLDHSSGLNPSDSLFVGENQSELHWLAAALLCLVLLSILEYAWVIRRHTTARSDGACEPRRGQTDDYQKRTGARIATNRKRAETSMFWMSMATWRPFLVVRVNLGHDKLDHQHVVTTMLTELRDQFERRFIDWRSRIGLMSRALWLAAVTATSLALGSAIGEVWLPSSGTTSWSARGVISAGVCIPDGRNTDGDDLLTRHLLTDLTPKKERPDRCIGTDPPTSGYGLRYSLFPILAWLATALLFRRLGLRYGHALYGPTFQRLVDTVQRLGGARRIVRRFGGLKFSSAVVKYEADQRERHTEQTQVQPRGAEQPLLSILEELGRDHVELPGGLRVSLPSPDIVFIFDELDKVGIAHDANANSQPSATVGDHAERLRSAQVSRLLSDLKNLVSSAPARFLFIGGRNLHDEWLADKTAQRPLLGNLFDAEVYIPSLLRDPVVVGRSERQLEDGTAAYLHAQITRARSRNDEWLGRHHIISKFNPSSPLVFVQNAQPTWHRADVAKKGEQSVLEFRRVGDPGCDELRWTGEVVREFIETLALRSRGNPKELGALLEASIRPTGRVIDTPAVRWEDFDCRHVLYLGDTDRFRLGLSGEIFRRLSRRFGPRLTLRDEKATRSLFQTADFLLKFHPRAFSLSSLERLDELVHIHRVPDLRNLLDELIRDWSSDYLHPILNGAYDFRFRSETQAEIAYLSRRSETDMASYNFTLDESQRLKEHYRRRLHHARQATEELLEAHITLADLHDLDQEFDVARHHYTEALRELDQIHGANDPATRLHANDENGAWIRRHMSWAIRRVRILLQIGMTYERTGDNEGAIVEYRNARSIAHAALLAFIDKEGRNIYLKSKSNKRGERLDTLKHLRVLYQPLFSEAWIAEKNRGSVDTSVSLVERELWRLRCVLPYVRDPHASTPRRIAAVHSNFAVTMSDLHQAAGDLYFWKGRPHEETSRYLNSSRYHYCVGIHDLRRTWLHRPKEDQNNPGRGGAAPLAEPIAHRFASLILAMAESFLAEVEVDPACSFEKLENSATEKDFIRWLNKEEVTALAWLGKWSDLKPTLSLASPTTKSRSSRQWKLVTCTAPSSTENLGHFLLLYELGAQLLESSGATEAAARMHLRRAYVVDQILWLLSPNHPDRDTLLTNARTGLQSALRLLDTAGSTDGDRAHHSMVQLAVQCASLELLGQPAASMRGLCGWLQAQGVDASDPATQLEQLVDRFAYPMGARLMALRSLVLHDAREHNSSPKRTNSVDDLLTFAELYNAPLHFTPFALGHALGRWATAYGSVSDANRVRAAARAQLKRSLDIVNGQRAYYEMLSGLYYLHDSFDDRHLHIHYALQIMGRSFTKLELKNLGPG